MGVKKVRFEDISKVDNPNNHNHFKVKSRRNEGVVYDVVCQGGVWFCTCPDHINRNHDCKHIVKVREYRDVFIRKWNAVRSNIHLSITKASSALSQERIGYYVDAIVKDLYTSGFDFITKE